MCGKVSHKAAKRQSEDNNCFIARCIYHVSLTGSDFNAGAGFCRLLLMGILHIRKHVDFFRVLVVVDQDL